VEEETYTTGQAARILRMSARGVRKMIDRGELEGVSPEESGGRGWKMPMHAVHDRDRPARVEPSPQAPESPERLSELEAEVRDLRYQLGLSEGRLELTEKAESTLREERARLLAERDRERERADRLEEELREARRPWWRRMFGS
jgi:excisionase family DNA binding protein